MEYTQVEDGWDFCLPSLTPDTLPLSSSYRPERQLLSGRGPG